MDIGGYSLKTLVDGYSKLRSDREERVEAFLSGKRSWLIVQEPRGEVFGDTLSAEESLERNLLRIAASLEAPSDHLPAMTPWFGAGVMAHVFGCEYVWRQGQPPSVRSRVASLDQVRDMKRPQWQDSEIAQLIMATIRTFTFTTGAALPIVCTETRSASDTAAMVLEPQEVLSGCLVQADAMFAFMRLINAVTIDFSRAQADAIGDALITPGGDFASKRGHRGLAIRDDNIAMCSERVSAEFNLALDEEIGRAMGGLAIGVSGAWQHSMAGLPDAAPSCFAVECSLDDATRPSPNAPEDVRDLFKGTGIAVHVRVTGQTDAMCDTLRRLLDPNLRLVVHPTYIDQATAERNYDTLDRMLRDYFVNACQCRL